MINSRSMGLSFWTITTLLLWLPQVAVTLSISNHDRTHPPTTTTPTTTTSIVSQSSLDSSRCDSDNRRDFLVATSALWNTLAITVAATTTTSKPANAAVAQSESAKLEAGLLESRVDSNVLNPPPYGMEGTDIFYPSWFAGNWKVASKTQDIQAPLGVGLFGGNVTYQNAMQDVGNTLAYESRFVSPTTDNSPSNSFIADREYNVRSIAKVAMGENSVVDVSMATPNKFSCLIAPKGAPSMISVDLLVLNRRQEAVGPNHFDCSEVVREIATPVDRPTRQQQPALLKEIETTSLYTYLPEKEEIHCRQRSAAFLLPSNENEMAMKLWQFSRGQAIDVRFYNVVYTRN